MLVQKVTQCPILSLSTDLVVMIMDYIPLSSHFYFAITCRTLAIASQTVLDRHRNAYAKYRVASDLDPSTVPLLLRSAFGQGDPIPAWHVRSFELWRDRTTWSDWQIYDVQKPLVYSPDCTPSSQQVQSETVRRYLTSFGPQADSDVEKGIIEKALEGNAEGQDGLLKALLLINCPRIENLYFVTRSQGMGSSLSWLEFFISRYIRDERSGDTDSDSNFESDTDDSKRSVAQVNSSPWPVGLFNLRNVAVGVTSATWMDDHHEMPSISVFAHLLRLPQIDSIYFNGLRCFDEDVDDSARESNYNAAEVIPARCSSVKHIFLHGCTDLDDFQDALWQAPRRLLSASFRHGGDEELLESTWIAQSLAEHQGESLGSLMWYGYDDRKLRGDHCCIYLFVEEGLEGFVTMKQVSINIYDIGLGVERAESTVDNENDERDDYVRFAVDLFPETMEVLVLWGAPFGSWLNDSEGKPGEAMLLQRAIVKMIITGRYKNLKAIFIEHEELTAEGPYQSTFCFEDAVAAGLAAGVHVYTLPHRRVIQHSIVFPRAPSAYDLAYGVYRGTRPANWTFDPYLGYDVPVTAMAI